MKNKPEYVAVISLVLNSLYLSELTYVFSIYPTIEIYSSDRSKVALLWKMITLPIEA
jgi:hypothetical protein